MTPLLDRPKDCISYARNQQNRDQLIRAILKDEHFNHWVRGFVMRNGGQESDIVTVTNDSIMNFLKICLKPDFEVNNVRAYLIGSAKFIWYQIFKKQRVYGDLENVAEPSEEEQITVDLISQEKTKVINKLLELVGEDCKKILTLWSYNFKMKAIAKELEFGSEGYAKKKKHLCLKKLISIVNDHPHLIKELRSYE